MRVHPSAVNHSVPLIRASMPLPLSQVYVGTLKVLTIGPPAAGSYRLPIPQLADSDAITATDAEHTVNRAQSPWRCAAAPVAAP